MPAFISTDRSIRDVLSFTLINGHLVMKPIYKYYKKEEKFLLSFFKRLSSKVDKSGAGGGKFRLII
jgi:hypothetical protein